MGVPRSLNNGGFELNFEVSVPLPSRSNKKGVTETGVKSREPVILHFPPTYPFQAPAILLRLDFNNSLSHIYPVFRSDEKYHLGPCVYDGVLDDLLHQEGDGLSEILNQLLDWLAKAAIDDLIDPRQGWEPIRRDDTFGWVVYDLPEIRALIQDKEGTLIYQCWFWGRKNQLYFVGGIDHRNPRGITPWLLKHSFFADKNSLNPSYGSLMIFAWSNSEVIVDQYLPESIYSLYQLYERAKEYGCYESLTNSLVSLAWAVKESAIDMPIFPVFVTLCARRPFNLIGDDSSLELIPYMIECHVEDTQLPFSESAVRIREDSPVFPMGHRHALTSKLLRGMSGETDTMKNGAIVHIGCGSVGSKIAMHLARSGHGPFKLIDKAAFSPHNVARHALITAAILIIVMEGIFKNSIKEFFVFWKLKNRLPGHRAFSHIGPSDPRIDMERVKQLFPHGLPVDPKEQNNEWFRLYRQYQNELQVFHSHKAFLLTRDLTSLTVVFIPLSILGHFLLGSKPQMLIYHLLILVILFIVISLSAKHYGERFVANVLAEASIRQCPRYG